jgi:hypothetical protein
VGYWVGYWVAGLLGLLLSWIGERQLDSGLLGACVADKQGRLVQRANKVGSSATGWGKAES